MEDKSIMSLSCRLPGGDLMISMEQIVKDLISYDTEEEWFEFKENWFQPSQLGEYISALSNVAALLELEQAYMIWGVRDDSHEIIGTNFNHHRNISGEPLAHWLARQMNPDVNFQFHEITIDGKRVVVLVIPAAQQVPTAFNNNRYIRIGSSKENLNRFPKKEIELFERLRKDDRTMENEEAIIQDLTFRKLFLYYSDSNIPLNENAFKKNLGFLTKDGHYNLLAQLLSDNSHMPIRVSIFEGTNKTSRLYAVREFGNDCLLSSLDKVLEFGDVLNIPRADERHRGIIRKEIDLFDRDAFREAVINAFVHNHWTDGNAPMITVYSDRIEILSRGTLAPKQTKQGFFLGESVPVNARLSDIFLQLHISERSGRGVPKIVDVYGKNAFEFRDNSIVVTIPFRSALENVDQKVEKYGIYLSPIRQMIVDEIRNNPNITQKELAKLIGKSSTTVANHIAFLKENGIIERVGSNKTGWWKVT